ncbi:MAG: hypothetical protein GWN58_54970, partial [Anaerolineae bacterium]|nr:hypothetical protein [Anaerolineae bacterium]
MIYEQIAEQSIKLLSCQTACILAWEEQEQIVRFVAGHGMNEADGESLLAMSGGPECLQQIGSQHQTVAIDDAQADPRVPPAWKEELDVQALLCVPIWGAEDPLGS